MNRKIYALAFVASLLSLASCDTGDDPILEQPKKVENTTTTTGATSTTATELKFEQVAIGNWKVKSVKIMGEEIPADCATKGKAIFSAEGKFSMLFQAIYKRLGPDCTTLALVKDEAINLSEKKVPLKMGPMTFNLDATVIDKDHLLLKQGGIASMEIVLERTSEAVVIEVPQATAPTTPPAMTPETIKQLLAGNWAVESISMRGNEDTACANQGTFEVTQEGNTSMRIFYKMGQCMPIIEKNNEPLVLTDKGEITVSTALMPGTPVHLAIQPAGSANINLVNEAMGLIIKLKKK